MFLIGDKVRQVNTATNRWQPLNITERSYRIEAEDVGEEYPLHNVKTKITEKMVGLTYIVMFTIPSYHYIKESC